MKTVELGFRGQGQGINWWLAYKDAKRDAGIDIGRVCHLQVIPWEYLKLDKDQRVWTPVTNGSFGLAAIGCFG
jgi:hypothetical protein